MSETDITRVTVRMPGAVDEWAGLRAKERGISKNAQIILTLQEKIAAEGKIGVKTSAAETQACEKG
ncbi:MAG: hypothetical protein OIF55_05110 [Amphritea sp.]|nr:hypothetical protein [Amphritea sp.]